MITPLSRNKLPLGVLNRPVRFLFMCIFISLMICCLIALSPLSSEECICPHNQESVAFKQTSKISVSRHLTLQRKSHKLAVLVPFRDRFEELLQFVPHMNKFLSQQHLNFKIYILNQVDNFRFNRASLINVGFLISQEECDYIAMHDVDLLPLNQELSYQYPVRPGPFHVASPELHPRYHYATFVGGILLIKREDFLLVNGMSNKYWGWGLEDDEFYVRLKEAGLNVSRPVNISTGSNNTFAHVHDRLKRKRDMAKCFNQREVTRRRDKETGLNNVAYAIAGEHKMNIDGASALILNIKLRCNREITPWCSCDDSDKMKPLSESFPAKKAKVEGVIVPNTKKTVKPDQSKKSS